MPTPKDQETQEQFIQRCIPEVIKDGSAKDTEQAFAMCSNMFVEQSDIREVTVDEFSGIEKISLVDAPAIEYDFVAMNKEVKLAAFEHDKQLVSGPVLIPNQLIYRIDEVTKKPYHQYFTAETIRQIVEKYFIEGKQDQVNVQHSLVVRDVCLVESWIIQDPTMDKSKLLGYDLPVGTWMATFKVNNQKVWEDLVKPGVVRGFSIEGPFVVNPSDKKELKQSKDELNILKAIEFLKAHPEL